MEDEINMAQNQGGSTTATTDTPSVENQNIESGFLAGFSENALADESTLDESDSKGQPTGDTNNNTNKPTQSNPRPERRTRSESRIQQLIAERNRREAENQELLKRLAAYEQPQLNLDNEGNATVEDIAEYSRKQAEYLIAENNQQHEQRMREYEQSISLERSISNIQNGVAERIAQTDFLNKDSENYNPELEKVVIESTLDYMQHLQSIGIDDYEAISEEVLAMIDKQIGLVKMANDQAKLQAVKAKSTMINGGAMVSSSVGVKSDDDDGFLAGFNS